MSCFQGRMKEYKNIAIDRFDADNLKSTAYFLSHCHEDHTVGLKLPAFHERLKSSVDVFIYCSEVTKILVLADINYKHLEKYVKTLEVGVPHSIIIPDFYSNKTETVTVTLIEAHHCPGSVMFLFEGGEGTALYTGDFRWDNNQTLREHALKSGQSIKEIKSLYIDTTFFSPENFFIPCRQDCMEAVYCMVSEWTATDKKNVIQISSRTRYGHEDLLVNVARRMKCKIHVSEEKYDVYEKISDLRDYFTADPAATVVHACNFCPQSPGKVKMKGSLKCGYLPPGGSSDNVMVIVPSTLFFAARGQLSLANIATKKNGIYRACYSFHSSYSEICDLVSYLRPQKVFPNVKPFKDHNMEEVQIRLNKFLTKTHKSHAVDSAVTKPLGRLKKRKRSRNSENVLTDSEGLVFNTPEKKRKKISSESLLEMEENGLEDKQITAKHTGGGDGEIDGKEDSDMEYSQSSSYRGSIDSGSELDLNLSDLDESKGKAEPVETGHFIESLSQSSGSGSLQLWLSDEDDPDYDDSVKNLNHVSHPASEIEKSAEVAENFNHVNEKTDAATKENTEISLISIENKNVAPNNKMEADIHKKTDAMKTDQEACVVHCNSEDEPSGVLDGPSSDQSFDNIQNLHSISNPETTIESKTAEPDNSKKSLNFISDKNHDVTETDLRKLENPVEEDKTVLVSNSDQRKSTNDSNDDETVEVSHVDQNKSADDDSNMNMNINTTDEDKLAIDDESKVDMIKAANSESADQLVNRCDASGDDLNANSCESVTGESVEIGECTKNSRTNEREKSEENHNFNEEAIVDKDEGNFNLLDKKMSSAADVARLEEKIARSDVADKTPQEDSNTTKNIEMECDSSKLTVTTNEDDLPIVMSKKIEEGTESKLESNVMEKEIGTGSELETDAKNHALLNHCSNNASESVSLLDQASEVCIEIADNVDTEPTAEKCSVPANDADSMVINITNEAESKVNGSSSKQANQNDSENKEVMVIDLSEDTEASEIGIVFEECKKNDGKPCENTLPVQSGCAIKTMKEIALDACNSKSKTTSVEANDGKESNGNSTQENKSPEILPLKELCSKTALDVDSLADGSQQRNSSEKSHKSADTSDSDSSHHKISPAANNGTSSQDGGHDIIDVMDCSGVKGRNDVSQGSDIEILSSIAANVEKSESYQSKSTDSKELGQSSPDRMKCDEKKENYLNSSLELFDHDDDSTDGDDYDYLQLELNGSRGHSNKVHRGNTSEISALKSNDHCLKPSIPKVETGRDSKSPVDLTDISPTKTPIDEIDDVIILSSQSMDKVKLDEEKLLQAYNSDMGIGFPQHPVKHGSCSSHTSHFSNFPSTSQENISPSILHRRLLDCSHFPNNSCSGGVKPEMVDSLNRFIGFGSDSDVTLPPSQHSFLTNTSEVINLDSDSDVGSDSDTDVAIVSQADYLNGIIENATCGHGKSDNPSDMSDNAENSRVVIDLTSDEEQL